MLRMGLKTEVISVDHLKPHLGPLLVEPAQQSGRCLHRILWITSFLGGGSGILQYYLCLELAFIASISGNTEGGKLQYYPCFKLTFIATTSGEEGDYSIICV